MKKINTIIMVAVMILLFACGTARRGPTVVTPLENMTAAVEEGEHEFMEYCSKCHPGGGAGLGPAINNKPLPGFLIKWQVRAGFGVMPAFSKDVVSEEELDHIVAYLKTMRKNKEKREAYDTATAGRD